MSHRTQSCIRREEGKNSVVTLAICNWRAGGGYILGVVSYGLKRWAKWWAELGHPGWLWGYQCQHLVLFPPDYSSSFKTTPPTCFGGCPGFFTFGLSCQEEISAQEEAFGQVQREGLWGMESPLKLASDGGGLTQIFPFQKYAPSSKTRVSCRHGCDRVQGKQKTGTQLQFHSEKPQTCAQPASRA